MEYNKDKNPILFALESLLKLKGKTTYQELAKVSGKKAIAVITVLNKNKTLIRMEKEKIVSVNPYEDGHSLRNRIFLSEKVYEQYPIYYGEDGLKIADKELLNELVKDHCFGGFGDSFNLKCISTKDTESIEKLHSLGYININKSKTEKLFLWKE